MTTKKNEQEEQQRKWETLFHYEMAAIDARNEAKARLTARLNADDFQCDHASLGAFIEVIDAIEHLTELHLTYTPEQWAFIRKAWQSGRLQAAAKGQLGRHND